MGERDWDLEWSDGSTSRWDDALGRWRYEPVTTAPAREAIPGEPPDETTPENAEGAPAPVPSDRAATHQTAGSELDAFDEREALDPPEPAIGRARSVPDIVPEEEERRSMWPAIVAGAVVGLGVAAAVLSFLR